MRIVIVSLSVNGAMGQYVQCLCGALGRFNEVVFAGPSHFAYTPVDFDWMKFTTGKTRYRAAFRILNPFAGVVLWHEIVSLRPDIVHILTGEAYPWSLLGAAMLRKAGIPFVVTIHDVKAHSKDCFGAVAELIRFPVIRAATGIHVHTEDARRLLMLRDPTLSLIRIITHGSFGPLYTRYRDPSICREKAIIFFGRIEHYKGVDVLLDAKRILDPSWKLILAGPGKLEPLFQELISSNSNVEVYNRYLSDKEVAHLFQRASVCALPYRNASQSSVPLISAAFGVPVVATAVGGFCEDVPRVNGILIPPDDSKALAVAIEKAYKVSAHYPSELEFTSISVRFVSLYQSCIASLRK